VEDCAVEPAFGIFKCFGDVAPRKCFVVCGIVVSLESGMDVCSLIICKELGSCRIVGDEEIGGD
jgi:hypothetical protein